MAYRIQVNKKIFSIRIKDISKTTIGVSIWRNKTLRFGTTFLKLTNIGEIRKWVREYIKKNDGKYFTR